ncbi:hypothetical protein Tco_0205861 [Tanacetum coccineum]
MEYCEDEDDYFTNIETKFPAIVFDKTSDATLSCGPTVSPLNDNKIDFRISFDESNDEDYTVIYDENSFSYKMIFVDNLETDSENDNDKVNMPSFLSPEPEVSYSNDLDFFKDFENEFPAIVYNDALTSKSDFLSKHIYPAKEIRRISAKTSQENAFDQFPIRHINAVYIHRIHEDKLFIDSVISKLGMLHKIYYERCAQLQGIQPIELHIRPTSLKITVGHLNGTLATINHVENLQLTNNVMLYDVLVVPGYCVSLLYVNKFIIDSKKFVGFDEDKCNIQVLKKEKILGTGSEIGGLYLFAMCNDYSVGKSNVVMSFHVSKLLWHNRLGRRADQVSPVLKHEMNISKNSYVPVCEDCHRAKPTREPFPLSGHKSKIVSELVYFDL